MNNEYKKAVVLGRVIDPSGGSPGSLLLIDGTRDCRRIPCDALGRFKIDVVGRRKVNLAVERDGDVVSEIELDPTTVTGELLIEIPPRPIIQEDEVSVAIRANRPRLLKDGVVDRLRALGPRLEIDEQSIGEVERLFDELEEISDLALSALGGDANALLNLRAGFEREIPFNFELDLARFKPGPNNFGIDPCRGVPRSPWTIVMAGRMMDGGEGTVWAGRAVSAILRRSEPAVRVTRALSVFETSKVGGDLLRDTVSFAADVSERGPSRLPLWELFSDGPRNMGAHRGFPYRSGPFDPVSFGGDFGERLTRSRFRTLLDPCNMEWLECVNSLLKSPPLPTPKPPHTRADKTDILVGQTAQIRLSPLGGSFETTQNPNWEIVFGGNTIVPSSWSANEVVLDIPATMPPGCYGLKWIVFDSIAELFNEQSDACARFFGNNRPTLPLAIPIPIGKVSVVGQPSIVAFTADGVAPKLLAEGCTLVEIAWTIDALVCANSASTFDLNIKDDTGSVLFQGVTTKGKISVTEKEDRTYTLTAKNTFSGVVSPPVVGTLQVERYQRLTAIRKVSPAGHVRAGSVVTIEVEISCPADDPAVVVVSSDQPSRCPGLTITIPVGQTKATGQVNAGAATGNVTLSGVVPVSGVVNAPVPASVGFIVNNPTFDALIGSNLEQCDGGSVTLRVRGSASVSAVGLSGPGGFVPSNALQEVSRSKPSDPASGTITIKADFNGPLASGTYAVETQADGVMLAGGQVVCALGAPTVNQPSATPVVVPVCLSTPVTLSATSRRATELLITNSNGTVVGGPVQGTSPCGSLSVTTTVQLTGSETFRVVARRPGASAAMADVTVGETTVMATTSHASLVNTMNRVTRQLPDGSTVQQEVTLFVYVVSVKPNAAQTTNRLGTITSPSGSISYTPAQCELFELWALRTDDPAEIGTLNWKFRSGAILGHPSFQAVQFPIGGN